MDIQELLLKIYPAIMDFFRIGFIPKEEDCHELTNAQYAAYSKQGGDISKPVYAVLPKDYRFLPTGKEMNIVTEDELATIRKAKASLQRLAERHGEKFDDDRELLVFAAKHLPSAFTEGTSYVQPKLKLIKPGEDAPVKQDNRELWCDTVGGDIGMNATLSVTLVEDGKTTQKATISSRAEKPTEKKKRRNTVKPSKLDCAINTGDGSPSVRCVFNLNVTDD
jgi:hypothetical protein